MFKKKKIGVKLLLFLLICCFAAQKICLIETVLLSTHNICFGREMKLSLMWRSDTIEMVLLSIHSIGFN